MNARDATRAYPSFPSTSYGLFTKDEDADLDVSAANSYIALAAGDDFRGLSWMTIDFRHDPEKVIEKAEGDGKGRIERERL